MSRAILVPTIAAIISLGLTSQVFAHAGTQADPLPFTQSQSGRVPLLATGGCSDGFTKLYIRPRAIDNYPATLQTSCFQNSVIPHLQSLLDPSEVVTKSGFGVKLLALPSGSASSAALDAAANSLKNSLDIVKGRVAVTGVTAVAN